MDWTKTVVWLQWGHVVCCAAQLFYTHQTTASFILQICRDAPIKYYKTMTFLFHICFCGCYMQFFCTPFFGYNIPTLKIQCICFKKCFQKTGRQRMFSRHIGVERVKPCWPHLHFQLSGREAQHWLCCPNVERQTSCTFEKIYTQLLHRDMQQLNE